MRALASALIALISLTTAAVSDQCYRRVYTKSHLAKHPDQLVISMLLKLEDSNSRWRMSVAERGQWRQLHGGGGCSAEGEYLYCSVDCDGGHIGIKFISGSSIYVYLKEPLGSGFIRLVPACDMVDDNSQELRAGKDDKIFKLYKVPMSACRGMDR